MGVSISAWSRAHTFGIIWGSLIAQPGWKDVPEEYKGLGGHSFVFLNYIYSGSAITGMAIADQGFQNDEPLARGDWGVWFGANLFKKQGRESGREPGHVRYGPNP